MKKLRGCVVHAFTGLGAGLAVLVVVGFLVDFRNFDRTSGGFEPRF